MRTLQILDALFPEIRQGILVATFTRPEKWWYLSEIAEALNTRPSSLQRETKVLVRSGILEQRREGTRLYLRPNPHLPIYAELRGMIEKTAGIIPTIRAALAPLSDGIDFAFVYGSVARSEERPSSDIDLFVVGRAGLSDLTPVVRKLERELGREVNVSHYSARDYARAVQQRDHFVSSVVKNAKEFVKGDRHDLERIARER
jgi:predicted nucleotidyltransferase